VIYSVLIPLGLLVVPWLLVRFVFATKATRSLPYRQHAWYLWVASAVWLASQLLPNVPISVETDSFTMHFMGGAVAAILFAYTVKVYRLGFDHTWQLWVGLYLFASGLGVLNELFEFTADKTWLIVLPDYVTTRDTWWDLVANTLGAFLTLACIRLLNMSAGKRSL
jgi:hypothetical protein